jgi:MobA-like NTP transferase domain
VYPGAENGTSTLREGWNEIKAIVLAAGKGTRRFPFTGVIPKPMAPVAGKPIVQHIFEFLARVGVDEVHVNVHYLADDILSSYGDEEARVGGARIYFTREEKLMGTAGGSQVPVRVVVCRGTGRRSGSRRIARRSRRSCGSRTPEGKEVRRWRGSERSTTVVREDNRGQVEPMADPAARWCAGRTYEFS